MKALLPPLLMLLLAGCAAPRHADQWRYRAAEATLEYRDAFLEADDSLAAEAYEIAENAAKQSADLDPLARLYLSECALRLAVLDPSDCPRYRVLSRIHHDTSHDAYHALISGRLQHDQIVALPPQYRAFAAAYASDDIDRARQAAETITPLHSRLVASALIRDRLDEPQVEALVDAASHHGYRRAVIAWMTYLQQRTADPDKALHLGETLRLLDR
jgi:hypothetical protein